MDADKPVPDPLTPPEPGPSWSADTGDGPPVDTDELDAVEAAESLDFSQATRTAGRDQTLDPPVIPPVPPEEAAEDPDAVVAVPFAGERASRPRTPWFVAVVILAITTAAGGVLSIVAFRWGNDWKERAVEAESEAGDLGDRFVAAQEEVTSLDAYVTALAEQKAILEDKQVVIAAERDTLEGENADATQRAVLAADAAGRTQVCLNDLRLLLTGLVDANAAGTKIDHLAPLVISAEATCAAADASYGAFYNAPSG